MANRRGQRIIVYPKCLSKFQTVMTTGNVGLDMDRGHDIAYEKIMEECATWRDDCKPIFVREDGEVIGNWPVPAEKVREWMEYARLIATGGYKQVLEDGPDVHGEESDSEHSDHGEDWSYATMYTPDMIGPDGKPKNGGPQRLSQEQVRAQRAAAAHRGSNPAEVTIQAPLDLAADPKASPKVPKKKKSVEGRAGGHGTEGVQGAMDTRETLPRDDAL
jgi:hypothetical protein